MQDAIYVYKNSVLTKIIDHYKRYPAVIQYPVLWINALTYGAILMLEKAFSLSLGVHNLVVLILAAIKIFIHLFIIDMLTEDCYSKKIISRYLGHENYMQADLSASLNLIDLDERDNFLFNQCLLDNSAITSFIVFFDYLINRPIQPDIWLLDVVRRIATVPFAILFIVMSQLTQLTQLLTVLPYQVHLGICSMALWTAFMGKLAITVVLNLPLYCVEAVMVGFDFLFNINKDKPLTPCEDNTRDGALNKDLSFNNNTLIEEDKTQYEPRFFPREQDVSIHTGLNAIDEGEYNKGLSN